MEIDILIPPTLHLKFLMFLRRTEIFKTYSHFSIREPNIKRLYNHKASLVSLLNLQSIISLVALNIVEHKTITNRIPHRNPETNNLKLK